MPFNRFRWRRRTKKTDPAADAAQPVSPEPPLAWAAPEIEWLWNAVSTSDARSVAVLSAERGEGRSSLCAALALRAAQGGRRTVLVDGDINSRTQVNLAGAVGGGSIRVVPSDDPELSKAWADREALSRMVATWHDEADLVLFDTSPVLSREPGGIPALALASVCDQAVVMVLAARTPSLRVEEAVNLVREAGIELLGTVINDRHNPALAEELEREAARLRKVWPRMHRRLSEGIRRSTLLGVRI